MNTQIVNLLSVDLKNEDSYYLKEASTLLKSGDIVAFPTETVYGLGANALEPDAVAKIFRAKSRPADNPLIVHISDISMLDYLVSDIPETADILIKNFWPGPLTILFRRSKRVPDIVTAGKDTVGIRMPSHPIFRELIQLADVPIAAPSANVSGKPSPTFGEDVIDDMSGKIPMIISAGRCDSGIESTIIDLTKDKPTLLRPGPISKEAIESLIGDVDIHPSALSSVKVKDADAPGMKYKHYSPSAKIVLVLDPEKLDDAIKRLSHDGKLMLISTKNIKSHDLDGIIDNKLIYNDISRLAHDLFYNFRKADRNNISTIIILGIDEKGLGLGVMNRLRKASSEIIE